MSSIETRDLSEKSVSPVDFKAGADRIQILV